MRFMVVSLITWLVPELNNILHPERLKKAVHSRVNHTNRDMLFYFLINKIFIYIIRLLPMIFINQVLETILESLELKIGIG